MIDSLEVIVNNMADILSSEKKSFFQEHRTLIFSAVISIFVALITAGATVLVSFRNIKNSQKAQSNKFKHEIEKIKLSILNENYKTLYNSKLKCMQALQYLAYKVILVKHDYNNSNENQYDPRPDIERSTYDFHHSYLNLYLKYSIIFDDEIFLKMTDLKKTMDGIIEDMSNKRGVGFLSEGERVREITLDLIAFIKKYLLLDNNYLRTIINENK